jgi:hypothetical protein
MLTQDALVQGSFVDDRDAASRLHRLRPIRVKHRRHYGLDLLLAELGHPGYVHHSNTPRKSALKGSRVGLFSFKSHNGVAYLAYDGAVDGFTVCVGELLQPVVSRTTPPHAVFSDDGRPRRRSTTTGPMRPASRLSSSSSDPDSQLDIKSCFATIHIIAQSPLSPRTLPCIMHHLWCCRAFRTCLMKLSGSIRRAAAYSSPLRSIPSLLIACQWTISAASVAEQAVPVSW